MSGLSSYETISISLSTLDIKHLLCLFRAHILQFDNRYLQTLIPIKFTGDYEMDYIPKPSEGEHPRKYQRIDRLEHQIAPMRNVQPELNKPVYI